MEKHLKEQKNIRLTARNVAKPIGLISTEKLLKNTLEVLNARDVGSRDNHHSLTVTTLIPVQRQLMYQSSEASPRNFTRRCRNVNSYVLTVID